MCCNLVARRAATQSLVTCWCPSTQLNELMLADTNTRCVDLTNTASVCSLMLTHCDAERRDPLNGGPIIIIGSRVEYSVKIISRPLRIASHLARVFSSRSSRLLTIHFCVAHAHIHTFASGADGKVFLPAVLLLLASTVGFRVRQSRVFVWALIAVAFAAYCWRFFNRKLAFGFFSCRG